MKLRRNIFASIALAVLAAAAVLMGISREAISQFVSGQITAGFGITITSSNPQGCLPASGQGCIVTLTTAGIYSKVVPVTGFNYTFANNQTKMLFEPAGTLAAGYVTLAAAPVDGQEACIFSTAAVTAFYLTANTGQSINNAVTALVANTRYCYTYSLANTTWDRSN